MIKARITNKELRESEMLVISTNGIDFKVLFTYGSPLWYTCGTYGWNADYWGTDSEVIFTDGYRPYYTHKLIDFLLIKDEYKKIDEALSKEAEETHKAGRLLDIEFEKRVVMYRNAMARDLYFAINGGEE